MPRGERCPACGRWADRRFVGGPYQCEAYTHLTGQDDCLGIIVSVADAQAVQAIREREGDRLRLAAHP